MKTRGKNKEEKDREGEVGKKVKKRGEREENDMQFESLPLSDLVTL